MFTKDLEIVFLQTLLRVYTRHVNHACSRIGRCLPFIPPLITYSLRSYIDQPCSFLHILHCDRFCKLHLRQGFTQSNQGLQLTRRRRHYIACTGLGSLRPHLHILFLQLIGCLITDDRMNVLACVGNVRLLLTPPTHSYCQQLLIDGCLLHQLLGML